MSPALACPRNSGAWGRTEPGCREPNTHGHTNPRKDPCIYYIMYLIYYNILHIYNMHYTYYVYIYICVHITINSIFFNLIELCWATFLLELLWVGDVRLGVLGSKADGQRLHASSKCSGGLGLSHEAMEIMSAPHIKPTN